MITGSVTAIATLIFLIGGLIVLLIWLLTMSKALDQTSHDMRSMEPGAVWLCLIPVFGLVWQFIIVNAVANGLAAELNSRGMFPKETKPGYGTGLTGCILVCFCIVPFAGVGLAIIGLVFLIVHMVRIREYNIALEQSGRWETRYAQRMAMLQQEQKNSWEGMQQNYEQPMPTQRSTYIPQDTKAYEPKEKPKNPFG